MTNYDELNVLSIEEYFGDMEISNSDKQLRIDVANDILEELDTIFIMLANYTYLFGADMIKSDIVDRIMSVISNRFELTDTDVAYAMAFASTLVANTLKDIENPTIFSDNRKILIAEEESSSICNNKDFIRAKLQGKTQKTWNGMNDRRERKSHLEKNNKTIGIDEYFVFKDCKMLYPHDAINGSMEQLAGCRCWVTYR